MRKFITDSKLNVVMERLTSEDYDQAEKITNLFKTNHASEKSFCGNVRVLFNKKGKAKLISDISNDKNSIASYEQITSALALYRTISLFKCGLDPHTTQDFYKTNWSVSLEHKASGKILMLGEWKGGFQIFTEESSVDDLPIEFIKDVENLLTLLVSEHCPIGYDGVVAGSVA